MSTDRLELNYPAGFEKAVHLTKSEFEHQLRLMAALKMFELGKISSGRAAELAGMARAEFFDTCGRYRVSIFNYPDEEIANELDSELTALGKE